MTDPPDNRSVATTTSAAASVRGMLIPLALAQFICSFAGSNMNVAINSIATDLGTSVHAVQTVITLFLLTMAALMIVGSKLTDVIGRKRCFMIGLTVYGAGAVIGALAPGIGVLAVGYSVFEGVGSALLIPPVYILTTVLIVDVKARAKAFGLISGMGGVGAAAGPLIGGLITTAISWRVSFLFQAAVVAVILILSRRITDPGIVGPRPAFDFVGAVLSAVGMFFIVVGILQASTSLTLTLVFMLLGAAIIGWFYLHIRSREKRNKTPLLSTRLFRSKTSNLGLVTQNIQWLMLMGTSMTVSVYLQIVHHYSAIETGAVFTAATIGILISASLAGRMARKRKQRNLVRAGFVVTIVGLLLVLGLGVAYGTVLVLVPGLFLVGLGTGVMLTFSVNIVQSAFPEHDQGEISGLSRSVSNLGSSLGTAISGTIIASSLFSGNRSYGFAVMSLVLFGLVGLVAALLLPPDSPAPAGEATSVAAEPASQTAE